MPFRNLLFLCLFVAVAVAAGAVEQARPPQPGAEPAAAAMTATRLYEIARRVDETAQRRGNSIEFTVEEYSVLIVYDEQADRMRIMVPVTRVAELEDGQLLRMMQANFDSALDARYAVARDLVWSVFIHPLSKLDDEEFVVGLGQTVNTAATFGESYSSGALVFQGGDSGDIERRRLIDRLRELIET